MAQAQIQRVADGGCAWHIAVKGRRCSALVAQPINLRERFHPVAIHQFRPEFAVRSHTAFSGSLTGLAEGPTCSRVRQPRPCQALASELSGSTSGSVSSDDTDETQLRIEFGVSRRSRQVTFTCNVCDGRTERLVNPRAWDKGTVFVQCAHCDAWHKIRDEAGLIEEIRFVDEPVSPKSEKNPQELEFDHEQHDLIKVDTDDTSASNN